MPLVLGEVGCILNCIEPPARHATAAQYMTCMAQVSWLGLLPSPCILIEAFCLLSWIICLVCITAALHPITQFYLFIISPRVTSPQCGDSDPDLFFTDRPRGTSGLGQRNREYLSIWADDSSGVLCGRSPMQCYEDFMVSFKGTFEQASSHQSSL